MNLINSPILIKKENENGVYYIPSSKLDSWDKKDEVTLEDRNAIIQNTLNNINIEHKQLEEIREMKEEDDTNKFSLSRKVKDENNTVEGNILNQIGLKRYCCRSHMIGHVQIIDKL